ncbi:MAG TPA: hypothetical protein PLL08_00850 [Bacteroidales bacterium]|nr:hypothetical protein [Bacteroidales bacterium]
MPPRYARGRSSVPSPRAVAVGSQSGKKSLQARFFAAASPAAYGFAGFPPAPSRSQSGMYTSKTEQIYLHVGTH